MPTRSSIVRALVLLVFGVAGPLVGLVVFAVGMGGSAMLGGRADGGWVTPFFMLYGLLFAHYMGLMWALAAGAAALLLEATNKLRAGLIGPLSGTITGTLDGWVGAVLLPPGTAAGDVADGLPLGFAAIMLAVHIVSATVSWWLARKITRQRHAAA
jgi:hypothetical protein